MQYTKIDQLINDLRLNDTVYVTRPAMPSLLRFNESLKNIWQSGWLTNNGEFHQALEKKLCEYLGVNYVNLFNNGTTALLVALQAIRINSGEVITTPFTFPATVHVLYWNKIKPVFCDIDPKTLNLDPAEIEKHISPDTKAIMPVHVYGNPCDVAAIQKIADRHGLMVIYDAAHAFGVQLGQRSVAEFGHLSALSFHATKLFSTIEGGALISNTSALWERIQSLKNFGIADEETVIGPGINGKMNEIQSAFGLLQLEMVKNEIEQRSHIAAAYRENLKDIPGITYFEDMPGVKHNYAYFPILVNQKHFGIDRNRAHEILRQCNIISRKYFHPLCSHYACYSSLPSARPDNLPNSEMAANRVLCLPIYGELPQDVPLRICNILREIHSVSRSN